MGDVTARLVKVRINAAGRRMVGNLQLSSPTERTSDLLNSPAPFLSVLPDEYAIQQGKPKSQAVAKRFVSYVETLEEPRSPSTAAPGGAFVSVVAELHKPQTQIIAEVFVPQGATVDQVLNDPRPFLNMRNVHFNNFVERYDFLAVGKSQLILVKT